MKGKPKFVAGTLGLLLAAGVAVRILFFGRNPQPENSRAQGAGGRPQGPVAVSIVAPEYRPITDLRELTGTVIPSYSYVIAAKVPGRLVNIGKRIGDRVRPDEIVGRIDDTEFRQSVQEAQAQVLITQASMAEARSQLTHLTRELNRVKELVGKGISSQAELDALSTQVEAQQSRVELTSAQLAQRQAILAQSQTRLGYSLLRAAQAGLVAQRHTDGGSQLAVGSPVLTIIGIDTVFVEIALTEREYSRIRPGSKATVMVDALAGKAFAGTVARAAPQFQTSSRTASAEIAVINDSLLLKPGMFARVSLTLAQNDSAQVVPSSAIVNRTGSSVVFVAEQSRARMIPVSVGITQGEWVEIVSPTLLGPVITLGNHLLSDSSAIAIGPPERGSSSMPGKESNTPGSRPASSQGTRP